MCWLEDGQERLVMDKPSPSDVGLADPRMERSFLQQVFAIVQSFADFERSTISYVHLLAITPILRWRVAPILRA